MWLFPECQAFLLRLSSMVGATCLAPRLHRGGQSHPHRQKESMSDNLYRTSTSWRSIAMQFSPKRGPLHFRASSGGLSEVSFLLCVDPFITNISQVWPLTRPSVENMLSSVIESVPATYNLKKKMVIPSALKVLWLKHRMFCSLWRQGHEVSISHCHPQVHEPGGEAQQVMKDTFSDDMWRVYYSCDWPPWALHYYKEFNLVCLLFLF